MDLIKKILKEDTFFNPKKIDDREEKRKKAWKLRIDKANKRSSENLPKNLSTAISNINSQLRDYIDNFTTFVNLVLEEIDIHGIIVNKVKLDNTNYGGAAIIFEINFNDKNDFQSLTEGLLDVKSKYVKIHTYRNYDRNTGGIYIILENLQISKENEIY